MSKRVLLVPVDESAAAKKLLEWTLQNLHKEGDEVHLLHVVRETMNVVVTTDFVNVESMMQPDERKQKAEDERAQLYMEAHFTPMLAARKVPYQHELYRASTDPDSVGSIICTRAEQLQAGVVVMAKHNKNVLTEFFIGSSTKYCMDHCKQPLLVMHCD